MNKSGYLLYIFISTFSLVNVLSKISFSDNSSINSFDFSIILFDLLVASLISLPFAFIGDYFESQLKRDKSIKDSGSLIPGHGGIWDRLDSHIAVVPIFMLVTNLMI